MGIFLQCVCISNHHVVHLYYNFLCQLYFDKAEKINVHMNTHTQKYFNFEKKVG